MGGLNDAIAVLSDKFPLALKRSTTQILIPCATSLVSIKYVCTFINASRLMLSYIIGVHNKSTTVTNINIFKVFELA
jgi:hypothetical protein